MGSRCKTRVRVRREARVLPGCLLVDQGMAGRTRGIVTHDKTRGVDVHNPIAECGSDGAIITPVETPTHFAVDPYLHKVATVVDGLSGRGCRESHLPSLTRSLPGWRLVSQPISGGYSRGADTRTMRPGIGGAGRSRS